MQDVNVLNFLKFNSSDDLRNGIVIESIVSCLLNTKEVLRSEFVNSAEGYSLSSLLILLSCSHSF